MQCPIRKLTKPVRKTAIPTETRLSHQDKKTAPRHDCGSVPSKHHTCRLWIRRRSRMETDSWILSSAIELTVVLLILNQISIFMRFFYKQEFQSLNFGALIFYLLVSLEVVFEGSKVKTRFAILTNPQPWKFVPCNLLRLASTLNTRPAIKVSVLAYANFYACILYKHILRIFNPAT